MKTTLLLIAGLALAACSKVDVTVPQTSARNDPPPAQMALVSAPATVAAPRPPGDRLVEIDRELSVITSDPSDADRRVALRAERAVLVSRGTNPIVGSTAQLSTAPATAAQPPPAPQQPGHIIVAPNSNAGDLPFLEQMLPSERRRYFEAIRVGNTSTLDIRHRRGGYNYNYNY